MKSFFDLAISVGPTLMGIPVILSESMVETVATKIYRNFKPWQRRGKNGNLRKLVWVKSTTRPMNSYMLVYGKIICHPETYYRFKNTLEDKNETI